jgi:hypothetical protein
VIRGLLAGAGAWLLTAALPFCVSAQSGTEVILNSDAVGPDAFEVLHRTFTRDGHTFVRASSAPPCRGAIEEQNVHARVWITWNDVDGHPVGLHLCFQDRCQSTERELEPIAKLDARAREELIAVVESGIAALLNRCPEEAWAADRVPAPGEPHVETKPNPRARRSTDRQHSPEVPASAITSTERVDESTTSNRVESPAPDAQPATPPPTELAPISGSQPSAATDAPVVTDARARPAIAFGASYGITRWNDSAVAQHVAGMVAYEIQAQRHVFVGLEVSYTPKFGVRYDDLRFTTTCVRVGFHVSLSWPLYRSLMLDAQLGPAMERLSLAPDSATARRLVDPRSVSHVDPLVSARVGPALRLDPSIVLAVLAQLDTGWMKRDFGFTSGDEARSVFSPDRTRLSIGLYLRAEL